MAFQFPPFPAMVDPIIKVADSQLSPDALDRIVGYGDTCMRLTPKMGMVGFHGHRRVDADVRVTEVAWFSSGMPETAWMYDALMQLIQHANSLYWQMDLWGFYDELQYCAYKAKSKAKKGGHFSWHMDMGDDYRRPQRKLAIVLTLTEQGKDYDGGDFYLFNGTPICIEGVRKRGMVSVFPSWVQHAVAPVTSGVRKSLVAWACGPRLR